MAKILVLRFSSIGDILLTTPVVRCLHLQLPGTEIHYLTKAAYKPLLEPNPYINKLYTFQKHTAEINRELTANHYDTIIDLHHNLRTALLKVHLRRPWSAFPKLNFRKWLLVNTGLNTLPAIHVVDRYFRAVRKLGVVNDKAGLDLFIPESEIVPLSILPDFMQDGYIALAIGARHFTKQIPSGLARQIIAQSPWPYVILGGPEDRAKAEEIRQAMPGKVFNACGQTGLMQSASLVAQAKAVVTSDTGIMHMAAALGKKTISVWGSTVPAFGMTPYMPSKEHLSVIIQNETLRCRPCSKLGHHRCPKGHFKCMEDIPAIRVADAIRQIV